MRSFVDVLQHWSTSLTSNSCKWLAILSSQSTALLVLLLAAPPLAAAIDNDAQLCTQSLNTSQVNAIVGLASPMEVLIWNIEKTENAGWRADLRKWGKNTQLVLIQEASKQAGIGAELSQFLHGSFANGYHTGKTQTGVLSLSSVSPELHCTLTAWEPWLGTPKATNITLYPITGRPHGLLVINIHAVNFTMGLEGFEEQIQAIAPLLRGHQGPVIVAGDFNTWSSIRASFVDNFMRDHRLEHVNFQPDLRTQFWDNPLDHVYAKGMDIASAHSVEVTTSDHNPLLVTLNFTNPNEHSSLSENSVTSLDVDDRE
ncbi:MAG: endonuclease/exonuclease/phosphatase (EEP) superfamily protein YafD [Halioglobus sp.]